MCFKQSNCLNDWHWIDFIFLTVSDNDVGEFAQFIRAFQWQSRYVNILKQMISFHYLRGFRCICQNRFAALSWWRDVYN